MIADKTEMLRPVSIKKSVRLATGSSADSNEGIYRNGGYHVDDNESESDFNSSLSSYSDLETDEERISRALRDWMSDHVVKDIRPREWVKRELLFSARLGVEPRIRRAGSDESIVTQLSLLSCSSNGREKPFKKRRRPRRNERSVQTNKSPVESKWIALSNRRVGVLDKMMKAQAALSLGPVLTTTDEIYDMLELDEQIMVFRCGNSKGIHLAPAGMKKSNSMTNINDDVIRPERRAASAGRTRFRGKAINFHELHRQIVVQRQAKLARKQRMLSRQTTRTSLHRKVRSVKDRMSSASTNSIDAMLYTPSELAMTEASHVEVKTALWAGDDKILEIDLNRDLTTKVKTKIATTTRALKRVTGYGDSNELQTTVGTLKEYPRYTEEDYAHIPKIAQSVRISPQLSHVIYQDIRVRMGRPRYHEISEQDLAVWNRGQLLDRKHRNLKVFTWLHSLKEDEFDNEVEPEIEDIIPGKRVRTDEVIHITAVDEVLVKPLFQRSQTKHTRMT